MVLGLTTTQIGVVIAALAIFVTILIWRWNQVESIWDVARDLREEYESKRIDDGYIYPVIDSIRGHESETRLRFLKRYLLFRSTGSIILSLRFDRHIFDEAIWEGRIFNETIAKEGVDLVDVRTDESSNRTTVTLEIPTANRGEFNEYVSQIAQYLKSLIEDLDVEITRR